MKSLGFTRFGRSNRRMFTLQFIDFALKDLGRALGKTQPGQPESGRGSPAARPVAYR
jgi:hypothetical protein